MILAPFEQDEAHGVAFYCMGLYYSKKIAKTHKTRPKKVHTKYYRYVSVYYRFATVGKKIHILT